MMWCMSKENESYRESFDLNTQLHSLGKPPGMYLSCRGDVDLIYPESLSGREFSEDEQSHRTSRRVVLSLCFEPIALRFHFILLLDLLLTVRSSIERWKTLIMWLQIMSLLAELALLVTCCVCCRILGVSTLHRHCFGEDKSEVSMRSSQNTFMFSQVDCFCGGRLQSLSSLYGLVMPSEILPSHNISFV